MSEVGVVLYCKHGEKLLNCKDCMNEFVANEMGQRDSRILQLENRVKHLETNNRDLTQRNAVLRQRPDLPADRLPAIKKYEGRIAKLESELEEIYSK